MNILHIIKEITNSDPELFDRLDSRRSVMRAFANVGKKATLAAVPVMMGGMFRKAYGQSNDAVLEILNYALTLEYLEAAFYAEAVKVSSTLLPSDAARGAIKTIGDHETAHVIFLQQAITSMGATPVSSPTFDFTAGGTFGNVFTDYTTFLAVAQAFEDTGVRAYKGRAGEITGGGALLEAALNIHSVEARHAAHIRYMRRNAGHSAGLKPWITGKETGIGAVVQPIYDGEETTTQAGINITNINGLNISQNAASEAFDEPLTKDQVLAIVTPFIV